VECGYGDGDEITDVGYVTSKGKKNITTYFRHTFAVADPATLGDLNLRLKRDDGAVVYLNGQEIYRSNMPAGTIEHSTVASGTAIDDGDTWFTQILSSAQFTLNQGANVIAVEIHNFSTSDGDISFDLGLDGTVVALGAVPEIAVEQPVGTDLTDGSATIDCGSAAIGVAAVPLTVTVKNTGTADLTGLALSADGANAADFVLGGLGATTLAPGASTTFSVTFTPAAAGSRAAAIHLASNDANENPFDVAFTGTGAKADAVVTTWPTASPITYGQTLASSVLSGGSATPAGTFAFTTPATAPAAGTAAQDVTFTPTDTANYNPASGPVSVAVAKADAVVATWPTASPITYGQTLADSVLSGGSATPAGTFAFTTPATAPAAGTAAQDVTFTPNDLANYNPATGSVEVTVNIPEIAVEQPVGTDLTDGSSTIDCGSADLGVAAVPLTVTVRNTGTADLTGLVLSADGANAADFALGSLGATTLAPGASTTFSVTFTPAADGSRAAALHLASSDADENPFDIALTGYGRSPLESWRFANFGSQANTGDSADTAHADGDALPNLLEYAMNLDPMVDDPFPIATTDTPSTIALIYPRNLTATDVTFTYEESADLGVTDPWSPVALAEEAVGPPANGVQMIKATRNLTPGENRKFLRIKVDAIP
jgi:hypothetical protein